ncbi:hypothetical protein ACN47E_001377 [Coniothyrium glycines]
MTGLLDLPSELLFEIIRHVLTTPCILKDGWRYRSPYEYTVVRNVVCYPSATTWPPDALGLLLTSKKMLAETQHYISSTPSIARLDLTMVDLHWIWPTWRNMPSRSQSLDQVWVKFIPCFTAGERHLQTPGVMPYNSGHSIDLIQDQLREFLCGFVLDWIGQILPKTTREVPSALDNCVLPEIGKLFITMDTRRYAHGKETLDLDEIPLRKVDGLAHLDFKHLYPTNVWSIFEHLTHMNQVLPFDTSPNGLIREHIAHGIEILLIGADTLE